MADRPGSVQYTNFNQNTAAAHAIAAGAVDESVKLLGLYLKADGIVDVTIEDSTGVDLIGPIAHAANDPFLLPVVGTDTPGWTRTATGLGLSVLLGGAVQVTGVVIWQRVPAHAELQ